jgi:hypothetical protein
VKKEQTVVSIEAVNAAPSALMAGEGVFFYTPLCRTNIN